MPSQLYFFVSIAFSLVAWALVTSRYVWPRLRDLPRTESLRPILMLHSFRFFGLAFLIPGVVSPELPRSFAQPAAYGDLVATGLALLALLTLSRGGGVVLVWLFNVWGTVDLLNAFYQGGRAGLVPGQLGAMYVIPTLVVPMMLVTHAIAFLILLRRDEVAAARPSVSFGGPARRPA